MRLERLLTLLGVAAAMAATAWPLAVLLGLENHTLRLQLATPVTIPLAGPVTAVALACIFILAGPRGEGRWTRRLVLLALAAVLALLTWYDRGLPIRLAAALPGTLREAGDWLRAFWYGTAEPPAAAPAFLLLCVGAWAYALGLWSVLRGRSGWPLWFAAGSLAPIILWIYDDPDTARHSLLALGAAMLWTATTLSVPPAVKRRSGIGLRLTAGLTGMAVVLTAATWLPAVEARPIRVLHEGIQRVIPLTARGPGVGFGGPGAGPPDRPLTLGGPFRPVTQGLLTVKVTTDDETPVPSNLYLRGVTRPVYTGHSLEVASPNPLLPLSGGPSLPAAVPALRVEQEIEVTGFASRLLYGAFQVQSVELPGETTVFSDAGGTLYGTAAVRPGMSYRVVSQVPRLTPSDLPALLAPAPPGYPDEEAAAGYLALPETVPRRVMDLAHRLTAGTASPYQAARSIEAFLRRFPYHEDTPFTPPGRDFVDYFLFDLQTGYCTYYTAAMMVMLRAVGIPARAVEGFILPLRGAGSYEVTGAQAHTWVEAYMPGYGWLTFEPTPAYPASPAATPASASPAGGQDEAAPDLLDPRAPLPALPPGLIPDLGALDPPGSDAPGAGGTPAGGLVVAVMAAATVLGVIVVGLQRRASSRDAAPADRIRRLYARARSLAAHAAVRAGTRPAAGPGPLSAEAVAALTPAELASVLGEVWPGLSAPLRDLTDLYQEAAYGPPGRRPGDDAARRAEAATRALIHELRKEIGWPGYLAARLFPDRPTRRASRRRRPSVPAVP